MKIKQILKKMIKEQLLEVESGGAASNPGKVKRGKSNFADDVHLNLMHPAGINSDDYSNWKGNIFYATAIQNINNKQDVDIQKALESVKNKILSKFPDFIVKIEEKQIATTLGYRIDMGRGKTTRYQLRVDIGNYDMSQYVPGTLR